MKAKTLKSLYTYGTLLVSIIIIPLALVLFGITPKWWLFLLCYFIFTYLGKLLYAIRQGVNVTSLEFIGEHNNNIIFNLDFNLGINKSFCIQGQLDKEIEITEKELRLLIYNNTTKNMILPAIVGEVIIGYTFANKNINIKFYRL